MNSWLLPILLLIALALMGVMRPTGLLGRGRAEQENERQGEAFQKWLEKDDKQNLPE